MGIITGSNPVLATKKIIMKAYKVELLIIDMENVGESEIVELLESTKYIYPQIKDVKSVDIGEWSDNHPLNKQDTCKEEYKKLFNL
jgi:hypothetical protein